MAGEFGPVLLNVWGIRSRRVDRKMEFGSDLEWLVISANSYKVIGLLVGEFGLVLLIFPIPVRFALKKCAFLTNMLSLSNVEVDVK